MLVAVQFGLPPPDTERMLMFTPQTLAAMLIGICALIGMFALSMLRSNDRSLRTFDRSTFTRETAPSATVSPALFTASTAEFAVLQPVIAASARMVEIATLVRIRNTPVLRAF